MAVFLFLYRLRDNGFITTTEPIEHFGESRQDPPKNSRFWTNQAIISPSRLPAPRSLISTNKVTSGPSRLRLLTMDERSKPFLWQTECPSYVISFGCQGARFSNT